MAQGMHNAFFTYERDRHNLFPFCAKLCQFTQTIQNALNRGKRCFSVSYPFFLANFVNLQARLETGATTVAMLVF